MSELEESSIVNGTEQESALGFVKLEDGEIVAFIMLMLVILCAGHGLRTVGFVRYLPETSFACIIGIVSGGFVSILPSTPEAKEIGSFVAFQKDFFFVFLLPQIILAAAYNLKKRPFFSNFIPIMSLAIFGTVINFIIVGGLMLAFQSLHGWTGVECFLFSALISATDPVSIIGVFEFIRVDDNLFAIILGESILNDAVSIVLYRTVEGFIDSPFTASSAAMGVVSFTVIFVGSMIIGVVCALVCALILRFMNVREMPAAEQAIVVLLAWGSYFVGEALYCSGIVAILFCGIALSHYASYNLRTKSKLVISKALGSVAYMSDVFVFLYVGFAVFSFKHVVNAKAIIFALFICLAARVFHVFTLGTIINFSRQMKRVMGNNELAFISFAGLRGAMAFAISLTITTENGQEIMTTTLAIALITIAALGSPAWLVLQKLNLVLPDDAPYPDAVDMPLDKVGLLERIDRKYMVPFFRRKGLKDPASRKASFAHAGAAMGVDDGHGGHAASPASEGDGGSVAMSVLSSSLRTSSSPSLTGRGAKGSSSSNAPPVAKSSGGGSGASAAAGGGKDDHSEYSYDEGEAGAAPRTTTRLAGRIPSKTSNLDLTEVSGGGAPSAPPPSD